MAFRLLYYMLLCFYCYVIVATPLINRKLFVVCLLLLAIMEKKLLLYFCLITFLGKITIPVFVCNGETKLKFEGREGASFIKNLLHFLSILRKKRSSPKIRYHFMFNLGGDFFRFCRLLFSRNLLHLELPFLSRRQMFPCPPPSVMPVPVYFKFWCWINFDKQFSSLF